MTAGAQGSMPSAIGGMGMAALFGMGVVAAVA